VHKTTQHYRYLMLELMMVSHKLNNAASNIVISKEEHQYLIPKFEIADVRRFLDCREVKQI